MTTLDAVEDVMSGHVAAVSRELAGAVLSADAAAPATVLLVDDTADFADEGGLLRLTDGTGATEDVAYTVVDFDGGTVTLASPLVGSYLAEDPVHVLDEESGGVVPEWQAEIVDDISGEPFSATVHHTLVDKLGEGMLGLRGWSVVVERDADDEWWVTEMVGKEPVVDGSFILPDTLPDPATPTEPPASSPAITLTGTAEGFIVEAEAVEPTTLIQYHVSTVEGFTPDATTAVGLPTRATVAYFTQGSEATGGFMLEATYYWKSVASNVVGAAAPSAEAAGSLDPEAISQIVTARLIAGFILAGSIQVGQILIDANEGILIPQTDGTEIHLPADGSPATFSGKIVTNDLTVETNAVLNGLSHIVGELSLLSGIPNPSSVPDLAQVLLPSTNDLPQGLEWAGLDYTLDGSIFFTCTTAYQQEADLYSVDTATGAILDTAHLGGSTWVYALTRRSAQLHVLLWDFNNSHLEYRTWNVDQLTGALTFVAQVPVTLGGDINISHRPAIGADGGDLWIGYKTTIGNLRLDRVNSATGDFVGGTTNADRVFLTGIGDEIKSISSLQFGTFDFGVKRLVVSSDTPRNGWNNWVWVFDTSGNEQAANGFPPATGGAIAWDGTRFVEKHRNSTDTMLFATRPTQVIRHFSYTWYDPNVTNGTHESQASPVDLANTYAPRRFMKVICPTPPEGGQVGDDAANSVRIYMGDSADSSTHHLLTGALDESDNYTALFEDEIVPATATPPASNEFAPLGQAGKITAADPNIIELNGQGNGVLSGYSFTGNSWVLESQTDDVYIDSEGVWQLGPLSNTTIVDTGNLLLTAPFSAASSYVNLQRIGNLVVASGQAFRTGGYNAGIDDSGNGRDVGVIIPAGLRPAINNHFSGVEYATGFRYRFRFETGGAIYLRANGDTGGGAMTFTTAWPV